MFEILVQYWETGDWQKAFLQVIPQRKGATAPASSGSATQPTESDAGSGSDNADHGGNTTDDDEDDEGASDSSHEETAEHDGDRRTTEAKRAKHDEAEHTTTDAAETATS